MHRWLTIMGILGFAYSITTSSGQLCFDVWKEKTMLLSGKTVFSHTLPPNFTVNWPCQKIDRDSTLMLSFWSNWMPYLGFQKACVEQVLVVAEKCKSLTRRSGHKKWMLSSFESPSNLWPEISYCRFWKANLQSLTLKWGDFQEGSLGGIGVTERRSWRDCRSRWSTSFSTTNRQTSGIGHEWLWFPT